MPALRRGGGWLPIRCANRRYWTFGIGSGVHIMVHPLLELVRETAEGAQTATQEQTG